MPDITQSLGHTLAFNQNLVVCDAVDLLDFSDDYLVFDTQVDATLTQVGNAVLGRDGRVSNEDVRTVQLCHVGRYQLNFRDLLSEASGHLKVGDIRAEVSEKELDGVVPKSGDKLVFPEGTYFVFAVDWDAMTLMYILWCRKS